MKAFTLQEAAAALGLPQMQAQATLADVCTDTRKIQPGSLFVCLRGERFDGHSFASQAAQLGAAALLVDHPVDADVPQLVVTDTGKALLQLAGWYRRRFRLPVVGLTGSVGKTTTKEFIALVLGAKYNTLKTQGNLNNEIGVPQMLFRLEDSHTAAPTVGLITNIGVSHIENLGSRAGILQAKLEILEGMAPDAPLIVNIDNDMLRTVKLGDRPLLTFAIDDQSADFTATDIAEQGSTTTFTVHHSTFTQPVTIPTVGIHNVYNALAAMAVGYVTGVDPVAAAAALANYVPAGMRQNLVQVGGVQVIEDCYNASPDSMRAALQTLGKLPVHRRYAVLGAMLELGDYAKEAHTQVGKMAAENGIDGVLAYGADAAYIVEAAKQAGLENARLFDTKEALAQSLTQQVQPGDGVLFKGSRGMHLEDVMHTVYERWEKA